MSAPTITAAEVERLVEVLDGAVGWMIAAEVAMALWSRDSEANKRRVRAIASAAGAGVVSYPGSPGYKLWKRCTVDELHACVAAYTSQADEMRRRRDLYWANARPKSRSWFVNCAGGVGSWMARLWLKR